MIRVLVEVGSDTARFGVAVKAYYSAASLGLVDLEMPESVAG